MAAKKFLVPEWGPVCLRMRQPVDGSGTHAGFTLPRPGAQANLLLSQLGGSQDPWTGGSMLYYSNRIKQGFRLAQTIVFGGDFTSRWGNYIFFPVHQYYRNHLVGSDVLREFLSLLNALLR